MVRNNKYISQIISCLFASGFLLYFLFKGQRTTSKIIIIPFLICSLSLLIRNFLYLLNKSKLALKFEKIFVISILIYYFGFLIYWDYVAIINKDYMSVLFSLIAWFGGIYIVYKRHLRYKNK